MITPEELEAEKPIVVSLTAQDIGTLYAQNYSPYMFQQYIMEKLKEAGCTAIEGVIRYKLVRGTLMRVRESLQGPGYFDYCWLPPAWIAAVNERGGFICENPEGLKVAVN